MPEIYGWQHFLYLGIVIVLMVFALILIKKYCKTEHQLLWAVKISGMVLFAAILWNRISIGIVAGTFKHFLPDSYCGISSLVLSLSAIFFKKDSSIFHCVAYTGLLGGILTLIYPDFLTQADSIFYSKTISGLVHHSIMVYLALLMVFTGFLKPALRKWYILPLGLCGYITYGVFLITVLGYSDAMYMFHPVLSGTIFYWYVLGILFLSAHALFLLIWDFSVKKRKITETANN